jgi:hypothetical protein
VVGGEGPFFSPDASAEIRDRYELCLRTGINSGLNDEDRGSFGAAGYCPWYEPIVDLGILFHRPPEEIYECWDKIWLDRTRVILQGRQLAAIDTSEKKPIEGE